ncbi:MAG: glycogen synthase GlgA [Clostridia bacterium]|nr:glycogen synthase GlgA [Clostridia bacterium]MBR0508661.1 glycogen synthase GlgA [Clostridia bacterium]MBR0537463.1 glycogen synthase GlgA [Clostridia bacterium]
MKVLYAVSEAKPFIAAGGLGDVAGSLPAALRRRLIGCRVVLPLYEGIPQKYKDEMHFITHITVPVSWRRQYCGIFEAKYNGVIYYFIDNQYYFKRQGIYGHYDDAERFAFFSRAVLEMLPAIDFKPDIINCNDWQTALVPVYYSKYYAWREGFENIKTVFTIHNIQYQGQYGHEVLGDVAGFAEEDAPLLENDGCINFMKGAIECANMVTTVSPSYANEILDPWYAHGLDHILNERRWKLHGILNGIDTVANDPATDPNLPANFSAEDPANKAVCKEALQKEMGLPVAPDVPLVGIVSRLVSHKGLDLVKCVLEEFLTTENVQMVVLGSGDWQYETFFSDMAARYPDRLAVRLGFVPALASRIYGGSDIFLMPSKSEPCGLSQMFALRYGSVPVVRATGGLRDSIQDSGNNEGNGFVFEDYNAHDMLHALRRAIHGYQDKEGWAILRRRAMECDNSWGKSANEYIKLYKALLKG